MLISIILIGDAMATKWWAKAKPHSYTRQDQGDMVTKATTRFNNNKLKPRRMFFAGY